MSEIFRTTTTPELQAAALATLAHLSHEAENKGDDVLLMQVADEISRRSDLERRIFRELYISQWHERMAKKKRTKKGPPHER